MRHCGLGLQHMNLERHSSSLNIMSLRIFKKNARWLMIRHVAGLILQCSQLRMCVLQSNYRLNHDQTIIGFPASNLRCNKKPDFLIQRPDLASHITVVQGQSNIATTSFAHFPVETAGGNISLWPLPFRLHSCPSIPFAPQAPCTQYSGTCGKIKSYHCWNTADFSHLHLILSSQQIRRLQTSSSFILISTWGNWKIRLLVWGHAIN